MIENKEIGNRIRVERAKKEYSQEYMAPRLHISLGAYSNIERGKTEISVKRLFMIAEILEVDVITLLPGCATEPRSTYALDANALQNIKDELEKIKQDLYELKAEPGPYPLAGSLREKRQ